MRTGGKEEDSVHKSLGGGLALGGLARGQARPPAPAERLGGGRDLRAVPLEVEERLLEAIVGEGGAGSRPGQDGGGSPRPEPLRQLLLEAGPGAGPRRAEAAAPRGPTATPERVEEPEGPAEAGQAEAAAQVVEEPQGAALEPRPLARPGRVQQEHHAVGARHGRLSTAQRPPAGPSERGCRHRPGSLLAPWSRASSLAAAERPPPPFLAPHWAAAERPNGAPAQCGARAGGGRGREGRSGASGSSGALRLLASRDVREEQSGIPLAGVRDESRGRSRRSERADWPLPPI